MNTIAEKIRKKVQKPKNPFVEVAEKYGVSVNYVRELARGSKKYKASRGKGLEIKKELERLAS
ncbi:XRE family transcriptional regulator [Capnocytophaga canis]|uniref:XRE family transcriptional regulator n=1 Tax=Capnocytophaga canis TaxID=1848903 RepID=UPI001561C0FF|nr:XRE family transcriptional regulator [Capnocytophaga canis]